MTAALAVRLVGIRHGLPFVYNPDEGLHFVPRAVDAAGGDWDPGYYENPSALTYLLAVVFLAADVLGAGIRSGFDADPTTAFTVARVVVALLGCALVLAVHRAGRACFDERVGVLAAAFVAFGFLPVFYSHQALNDVPTMLPVTLALLACVALLDRGGPGRAALAGALVGLAAGTKYLAAPLALVVAVAVVLRVVDRKERMTRGVLLLLLAALACVAALLLTNPYLALDLDTAREQLGGQSTQAASAKLGQDGTAWTYYPVSLLWGLGVVPTALAALGAVAAFRTDHRRALLLTTFPVALLAYLGTQDRFFARWLLPAYPMLAVLAAYGAVRLAGWVRERLAADRSRGAWVLPVLAAVSLAQPVVDAVRSDAVLVRADTRGLALDWMEDHVGGSRRIVVEPAVPGRYLPADGGWTRFPVSRPYQAYEERLDPALVDDYRAGGYCWVMVNSHQRDRGLAAGLPGAEAYYRRLDEESTVVARFSPYRPGATAPDFSYDFSFDWYPWAFERPGPYVELRRLTDCAVS